MGHGYAFRCEVCDIEPMWGVTRRGDAVCSWACAEHLSDVCVNLQRDHEVTELVVKHWEKSVEWAELGEMLRKVNP